MRPKPSANDNATTLAKSARLLTWDEPDDSVAAQVAQLRAFLDRFEPEGPDLQSRDLDVLQKLSDVQRGHVEGRKAQLVAAILRALEARNVDEPHGTTVRRVLRAATKLEPQLADLKLRDADERAIAGGKASHYHALRVAARLATLSGILSCPGIDPRSAAAFENSLQRAVGSFTTACKRKPIKRRSKKR